MKILSLYIESFGKLSDYLFEFSPKMNSIYEENGWGKTTMSVFIKTMLYGFTNKAERERYTPWNNKNTFGGTLKIEVNGKKYRIDRRFDPKKASGDTLNIYDLGTNLELKDIGNNIGEKFLNLNVDSFERSVFIPQKELEEGFGSDIEAKLANLIGGTNDSQSYEEAIEILDSKSKLLRMNSKKGLILDKKKELAEVQNEIAECNNKMTGINDIEKQIDIINTEINDLNEKKKKINSKIIRYTKEQDKKSKIAVAKKYQEDIESTKELLRQNNEVFNGVSITLEDVLTIRSKNKELISMKYEYDLKKNEAGLDEKLDEFKTSLGFKDNLPTEDEIALTTKRIQKYQNIKGIINAHTNEPVKKKPIGTIIAVILSTLLLLGGLALLLTGLFGGREKELFTNIGIVIMVVSVLGYVSGLALFIVNYSHNQSTSYTRVKNYDFELREIEGQIRDFFGRFHLYSSDFSNNLYTVRSNLQRYNDALTESAKKREENSKLERKINENEKIIQQFLSRFKTTAPTTEEKIGELNTHLRRKTEIENNLAYKQNTYKQYIQIHGLDDINENEEDIDSLNALMVDIENKINELNKNLTIKSNRVVEFETDISRLDELNEKEEALSNEIRALEHEYEIVNITETYLKKAQTALLEKYVKPMKDSVDKYVSLLLKNNKDYSIDVNFKFQFITKNGLKGIDQYSRGYQTIITLCMRLALIDCLYPKEKPFVVFDDPFVNFDDEKLELCKNLMSDIANHYQIIYFTCHDSRVIK